MKKKIFFSAFSYWYEPCVEEMAKPFIYYCKNYSKSYQNQWRVHPLNYDIYIGLFKCGMGIVRMKYDYNLKGGGGWNLKKVLSHCHIFFSFALVEALAISFVH